MRTVSGIFQTREAAERAVAHLHSIGIKDEQISFLAPGTSTEELDASVPTTETEQPGMGKAIGGWAGGALGVAGGMHIGAAAASLFVPGVGPVIAAGLIGAALLGIGGASVGLAAGGALEDAVAEGLPQDELYVYEDALRQGRTVVIVVGDDDAQGESTRNILAQAGAESIDAARESWWVGLRDAEDEQYAGQGRDFKRDEPYYRKGFEAALHPQLRDRSYEDNSELLRERHAGAYEHEAFRRGYERGQAYHRGLKEKYKA
ncbi:MAG TPA: hypothetical protein VGX92_22185 [Pyrinomonadaceae bacterium]|jgi:hypothetical protein|nr:hypothetical protein [Pyrinomonadaceae bacterium]